MPSTEKSFKILIAGGGVAGLVLANMLERFQIDYLLLEAHGNIVPTIGAGIGIFPNGARILDQLDLFEPIAELSNTDEQGNHIHKENGDCLLCVSDFYNHLKHRHGYPIAFVDRKSLLRVLYDRLQNKNRVLLNKKVDRVELLDGGVEVFTTDGQSVRGSLLIGADGVHSAVRREMFRIANEKTPGYFAVDEHQHSSCHYLCLFGISQDVPDWVHGQIYHVLGRGYSQLVVSGLDPGQVYWFFFEKLPETKYGKDIPRCTREMEAQIINKYEHCPVTKATTLGQIYAKRKISTLTPLHEYTHEKWFFNRIFIIGDSAHKLNPISGQGGNAAIESAAEFVNELLEKRASRAEGLDGLTDKDITDIFMRVQSARHDRAKDLVSAAHLQQSLTAYEKPLVAKFLYEYRLPLGGNSAFLDLFGEKFVSGPRLKYLPLKGRPRLIPYDDELPSRPWPSRIVLLLQAFFILGFAYLLLKAQNLSNHSWLWFDNRNKTMTTFVTATDASGIFNDPFSSVFMQPDTEKQVVYNIYRLSQLISPILIYIVEGYRLGNRTSILALPSLFLLAIQYKGIALVSPIYAILSTFFSTSLLTGRFVKPEVARALVPALMLGYVFPTMLILFDAFGIAKWVTWVSHAYRFAPFFVCSLTFSFAYLGRIGQSIDKTQKDREQSDCKDCKAQDEFESYKGQDVPILKFAYLFAFALQAMVHITLFAYAYKEPITTMSQIVFQSYRNNNNHLSIGQTTDLFSSDLAVAFTTWFISNIYSIWKLRCLGYIKTQDGLVSTLSVLAGQIVVGPGATWAGLWHWREGVLVGLQSV